MAESNQPDKKLKQRPRLKDLGKHGLWIYGAVVSLAMREAIVGVNANGMSPSDQNVIPARAPASQPFDPHTLPA